MKAAWVALALLSVPHVSWGQSRAVGTETWTVTANTAIKADAEHEYYASANIAVLFGGNNKWEAAVQRLKAQGDNTYYIRSQKSPYRTEDKNKLNMNCMPDAGNYFHLRFFVGGNFKLKFAYSSKTDPRKMYAVYEDNNSNKKYAENASATVGGITYTPNIENTAGAEDNYISLPATGTTTDNKAAIKSGELTFTAKAGEDYYLWINNTEEFSFGGFTFDVNQDNRFNAFEPNVHEHIVWGKPKNPSTPSGAKHITMMYGGWLNHTNGVKSANGWDGSAWNYMPNGTADNQYNGLTDQWEVAQPEKSLILLDGFTNYTSGCGNNPTDGIYEPYAVGKGVSSIPCRGTYYKFEPQKDGYLTVYVRQNATNPVYFIDETATPQKSDDVVAGQDDATVTRADDNSYTSSVASCVRYSFPIKAGKTYFLFQNNAQLGFFGFTFGADETAETNVDLTEAKAVSNAKVTYTRNFKTGVWNTIVLPFSMTEAEVRNAFGDETEVSEFSNIDENGKVHFVQNYYRLLEAGKPYIIKPSKADITTFTTAGCVTMTDTQAQAIVSNGYAFTGAYASEYMPAGSYYFTVKNNVSGIARTTAAKASGDFRAYFKKVSANANALKFDFDMTETGISEVKTAKQVNSGNIYNLQGVLVATDGDFSRLGKGIYVMNGKKYQK